MRRFIPLAVLILAPSASRACLWDYDTLKQERARFPDALEIITGKFLRHSPEFYQWRIKDRLQKLKTDPQNPALYDDLAVAYAKTGQYAKAIETMQAVEKFAPGRYETYSNLGTFYFLAGDIAKALPIIDKALAINPDAHFGREKYQRWLGEYLLGSQSDTFAQFLLIKHGHRLTEEELRAAAKGVLGMMRFASHDSPVLLKALRDLLKVDRYGSHPGQDAKRLAARVCLKLGYSATDRSFTQAAVTDAREVLEFQTRSGQTSDQLPVEELAARFKEELTEAEAWYADLRAKEIGWIDSGQNPEVEFDKLYAEEPRLPDEPTDAFPRPWHAKYRLVLVGSGCFLVVALSFGGLIFLAIRLGRRWRSNG